MVGRFTDALGRNNDSSLLKMADQRWRLDFEGLVGCKFYVWYGKTGSEE